ncbi:PaaI family thioesterase [Pseudomonas sp. NA-150]|uniref:PaaI family thioesterase n=1 Tax=Pseudomonas sp. NA-150 TaxID=3367525 RepID=UPI0037C5AEDF
MPTASNEEKLARWIAEEHAARARLGDPGTTPLADVSSMMPNDFFERISNGELPCPPIGALMDFIPLEWSPGRFVFQGTPDARHYNPLGIVHGGYAATLLDSCMGCAIHTQLKKGLGYTTLDLRISYIRALTDTTGPVRAEGKVIHVGRSTALAEGRLYDVDDRLYAIGSTTCMIFDLTQKV